MRVIETSRLRLRPFEPADTEAASAWVSAAAGALKLRRLGAFVHPDNAASIRVLQKLGFRSQRREAVMGMPSIVFGLELGDARGAGEG